ncbi:site-specific integrase [Metallibacterium sp.]|uniref:tyrosine-type recombinase/integrase n=1 Tax=Metallibacterium sp. TaxID=2940281 RepID=UPI0026135803|nr:site-specific integrase [Metallibacterium sp.]
MKVKWNVLALKALRPRAREYDRGIEGKRGLYVRVLPSGQRRFMLRFGAAGTKMMLETPASDLAGVDQEYTALRAKYLAGIDPREERRAQREATTKAKSADLARLTMGALCERYLTDHASKKRTGAEDARRCYSNILPVLGTLKADEVNRAQVRELLATIAQRAPIESNRTLALLRKVFAFALERDVVAMNPCIGIKPLGIEKARERALQTAGELRAFWTLTDPDAGHLPEHAGAALRFLLLTGARSDEVCSMPWSEISFDAATWILPAERSKNGRAHLVPLTASMLAILGNRPQTDRPVFWPATAMLEPRTLAKLLRTALASGAVKVEPFTVHDLRRSVETGMAAAGVMAEVRDRVLNHAPRGTGARHYNVHDYASEKRIALETWERRLQSLLTGNAAKNVTPLRRPRSA